MQRTITAIVFIFLFFFSANTWAQDSVRSITADEIIKVALAQNRQVSISKMDEYIAAAAYRETEAMYLPQVSFSYSAFNSNDPLNVFAFKLQDKAIAATDFNPALLNGPSGRTDFVTQLNLRQPLVNMDLWYMRKAAAKQQEIYQYKTQRTRDMIILQARQAYLQLQLAYDARQVLLESKDMLQAMYKFTNDRYQQGLLQKSDLLNVEVQQKITEAALAETQSNIRNASDQISLLMNKKPGTVYTAGTVSLNEEFAPLPDSIPASRADLKAMETAAGATGLLIRSQKMSFLPRLNLMANYQLHDAAALNFGAGAYFAGVQLSWDIFRGNAAKNKISTLKQQRAKILAEAAATKESDQVELQKAYRSFSDATYKMEQQNAAGNAAAEVFRILQNRYAAGLVNTTDVLRAQNQVSQQKLGYTQAVFYKNNAYAYWQFLTSSGNK